MLFRIFSIIRRLISVLIVIPLSLFEYCLRCVEWLIGADDDINLQTSGWPSDIGCFFGLIS